MNDNLILYRKLEPVQIACIKERIESRAEIPAIFERLRAACGSVIQGDPLAIFKGGALKDGYLVEAAFPVSCPVENGEVYSRTLEAASTLSLIHYGGHDTIREAVLQIYAHLREHAWTTSLLRREVYRVHNPSRPEMNVTEVQVILHEWDRFLVEAAGRELGEDARQVISQGSQAINPQTSFQDYLDWIRGAIDRLDALTQDEQVKCRVVSSCAHIFPDERIEHLRQVYLQGEFDDILREMYTDHFWYEKPVRRGNVIYMRKNPYDPDGYASASTPAARRKAYCHCPFVQPHLEELPSRLSPTFCYCGAGWYRRLWEGVLGLPVRIDHVETLLRGHDQCTLMITLPLLLQGAFPLEP